ncbi:MAG: hypothetical protein PHC53_05625 [Patescibacteria group bacterium]|nr:hypothetical protein [Patescibacteria group bacterium]
MQKFDIPSLKVNPEATPAHETPSKRKFSMMEAKPAPREIPAAETPSARRRSLRLVKPEAEEARRVASIRKGVAEVSYKPPTDVDKLRAKTKSLKGRIEALVGHPVKGKTAEEIKSNVSLGDRFSAWLSKISGKKESSSLSDLLNQLHLAEKTLEVKLTPEISIAEPAAPPRKPKTLRSIKSRLEEAKAKSESLEADKALENLHVEVEPETPKENIATRIESAKARGRKNMTLGAEDIIPEIKTSPLAESVRMPEAEKEVEIPVHFEEETAEKTPDLKQQLSDIGLYDEALVFGYLDNPDIKQKGLKLVELFKAEEAKTNQLEGEITSLEKERDEALDKTTDKKTKKSIKRQYWQKINNLRQTIERSGEQWHRTYESRKEDLENLAKEAQTKGETKRSELAEEITKEKFETGQAKSAEAKFRFDATQKMDDILFYSKRNPDYEDLGRQWKHPKISKLLDELLRQDIQKRIEGDARLEEESLMREDFEARLTKARKTDDKIAEKAIQHEYQQALSDFRQKTMDLVSQWEHEYEEKIDKIAAQAKEISEEAKLPEAEIIEEKAPSEIAPPPPTARERKRRLELQDALVGKTQPSVEVGEGELTPEEIEAVYGEPEEVSSQGEKIVKAATKFLEENEEIAKAGWLGQILRDHPLVEKHKADPAVARILDDIKHHLEVFNARRDGMVERFKRKPKKVTQEFKDMVIERSEFVNRSIDELESLAKELENPSAIKKIEKTPSLRAKEKADPYHNLRQELQERVKDEKQIEDYIQLASQRDRYLRENDEVEAALYQARIDTFNTAWRELGILGVKEDPSVTTTGRSGIGHMGVIGRNLASDRIQRGKYEGDVPSGVREKTRSTLEVTRRLKTKELQPFNTAWAMERLGNGAAKRWDQIAPVIMERKLGPVIAREINNMVQQIDKLDESEKELLSDEYRSLPKMMGLVRNTPRFDQSPEAAAYVFLRALKPNNSSDFLAQDVVEATLNKLDEEIAKAEQESAKEKEEKKKEEEQGFSMMRAKPKPRGTEPKIETPNVTKPKTKKARTVRAPGKSEAA